MANSQISRDESLVAPPDLNEAEQQDVMLKAERLGLRRPTDDLTAVPAGSPPPGAGWTKVKNIPAPGSGKLYTIYILSHEPHRRGPAGTKSRPPAKHPGVKSKTHHQKPHAPTGSSDLVSKSLSKSTSNSASDSASNSASNLTSPPTPDKKKEQWLGAINSDHLTEAIEGVRKTMEDPGATEDQITASVQQGLKEAHNVAILGGDDDPRVALMMQQVAEATSRVGEMRNDAFDKALQQEERTPGSVSDQQITYHVQRVLGAEKQRQLLGAGDQNNSRAMDLVVKAIGIVGDRKADSVQNMLDQEKRSPGAVSEAQFSKAIGDLIGVAKQTQLLGIQRPKTEGAMDSVAEVIKVLIRRKSDARRKMLEQKNDPNSGVTDQQIQDVTIELAKMKEQARMLGIQVTE